MTKYTEQQPQRCLIEIIATDYKNTQRHGFVVNRDEVVAFVSTAMWLLDKGGYDNIAEMLSPLITSERQQMFTIDIITEKNKIMLAVYED